MQGMQVAAEPLSAPPYATECAMTLTAHMFWIRSFNFCLFVTPFLNFPLFVSVARLHV